MHFFIFLHPGPIHDEAGIHPGDSRQKTGMQLNGSITLAHPLIHSNQLNTASLATSMFFVLWEKTREPGGNRTPTQEAMHRNSIESDEGLWGCSSTCCPTVLPDYFKITVISLEMRLNSALDWNTIFELEFDWCPSFSCSFTFPLSGTDRFVHILYAMYCLFWRSALLI